MMSTFVNTSAATAQTAQPADAGQPVQAAQASSPAQPAAPGTNAAPTPAAPAAAFAQWLGLQVDAAAPAATQPAAAPQDTAAADSSAAGDQDAADQDSSLLAAMAMPLMPLTPTQIAQAVQVAQGQFGNPGTGTAAASPGDADKSGSGGARVATGQAGIAAVLAGSMQATAPDKVRRTDIALQQANPLAAQAGQQDGGAVRLAIQSAAGNAAGGNGADSGAQDGGADQAAAQATGTVQLAGAVAAAPASSQPATDTVKLAGPPTAWRQSLQEALGDRLQLQVGKNMEQATIRLEPPQLGRIDIAIRHSNGTLEVNISATHSEVLRQLQTISDNLRSDLSQRQFTEVAVSVTPTPKSSNAAPFGDPQQGGRGRQQDRDQDEPGRALAEAGKPASAFSLGAREA